MDASTSNFLPAISADPARLARSTLAALKPGDWGRINAIFRRELAGYFTTPVAYVFIVIFLVTAGALTFYFGNFFERGQADLQPFFEFHPWLYLFLVPALAMRLWAEERRTGAIELLLTLPVTISEAALGKFLAAWAFTGVALAGTLPMWITVNILGEPDNGVILAGYLGSFLMAGGFLAIGSACSALTKSQVIAFVLSAALCFFFLALGTSIVLGPLQAALPAGIAHAIAGLSFLSHFDSIQRGELALSDLVFFLSVIALFLFATVQSVESTKAD
jgi:ABC-2 type transport system permease protein